ncbi:MAG: hypothetical protein B6I34_06500 [Anaerolineaceae bacterium 4572_32.1]|nr:MAG: hypothetical protein B6I34_06500 [Anaerolineaceae bacterium 4572_32.1]
MVVALIVPAAVGLWILAEPVIALLFQHGDFTSLDTAWVTLALRAYLIGLIFAAIDWPLNYAFYARQDTVTPNVVAVISVGVYLAVALSWVEPLGMLGLVLADSAKHLTHVLVMWILTWRRMGNLRGLGVGKTLLKAAAASALMAAAVLAAGNGLERVVSGGGMTTWLALVVGAGGAGLIVYLLAGWVLRMEELRQILQIVQRRLGRQVNLTK